jgi:putative transposase
MIDRQAALPVKRQCALLVVNRSGVYYTPHAVAPRDLALMRRLDELHLEFPYYGARRLCWQLRREGQQIGQDHVATLMRRMGVEAHYRKPRTSIAARGALIRPYLLEGLKIVHPGQVWSSDITYLPMAHGFLYLVAILAVASRKVLSFKLSSTLTAGFCVAALEQALQEFGPPQILNTDQGSQFTSQEWTQVLEEAGVRISMDGKGWVDNVFIERLWRTMKYEEVYQHAYADGWEARHRLGQFFRPTTAEGCIRSWGIARRMKCILARCH